MLRGSILLAIASIGFSAVQASISSQCINIRLQNTWLIADCLTGSGTTRIQSSVYLQNRITNHESVLEWQVNGNFASSCTGCTIVSPATLSCSCRPTGGQAVPASINLEDHIAVYSGFLLSNLSGTPTPPVTASSISFPSDPSWQVFYGNTSCYSTNTDTCPNTGVGSETTCSQYPSVSTNDGVLNCFAFRWPVSVPVWETFADFKVVAPSGAYKFQLFDTLDCTGGVKGTIAPNELGTCKEFRKQMYAFSAVPLWNAQT
ncbi:hypothetical protein H072_1743 [Dactylellina haptotyla CBS 200.50]|uniref:Cyanovirin-N domain-containing protein n=1 Tax=Dactylellina haptotyla (strain CBS 200.50) TaxID=1284197 RepID=S8C983_DACHA|nr:hypothetical protein H072_1743 [Dactylellina haptotyla CBS 200.50]